MASGRREVPRTADLTELVLKTPYGRWLWWPDLAEVEYRLNGQRRAIQTLHLNDLANNRMGAYVRSVHAEDRFIRTGFRPSHSR